MHGAAASLAFRACVLLVRAAGYPPVAVVMGLSVLTVLVVAFGFGLPGWIRTGRGSGGCCTAWAPGNRWCRWGWAEVCCSRGCCRGERLGRLA